jgi:hypothetical protein
MMMIKLNLALYLNLFQEFPKKIKLMNTDGWIPSETYNNTDGNVLVDKFLKEVDRFDKG